jgi:stage V sporulation protein AC
MYHLNNIDNNIIMNNKEYDELVKSIILKENPLKNIMIAFFSGGLIAVLCQLLSEWYVKLFSIAVSKSYLYVSITLVVIGSLLTGLGFFDKVLSFCKCGLIVPTTGFANTMTSSAMDYKKEGFVKGIGSNIFKLTGSIILYGVIFGIIFGYIRSLIL